MARSRHTKNPSSKAHATPSPRLEVQASFPDVRPASRFWQRDLPAIAGIAMVLIPLLWHRPCWTSRHAEDDLDHLLFVADYQLGDRSLVNYVLCPINEHLLPLWRLWYLACWKTFGLEPQGWHITVSLVHGLGAAALFMLLRAVTGQIRGAALGAGLWAIAGIGGWDSPLSWLPASHLTFGVTGILGAMACLTQYRISSGWKWPALMAGCMLFAVGSMSAMWVLLPALAVQWLLLEREPTAGWRPKPAWLVGWLVPFLLLSSLAIAGATRVFLEAPSQPTGHDSIAGATRALASWELTMERLLVRDPGSPLDVHLPWRTTAGLVLAITALGMAGRFWRLVFLFLGTVLVYSVLVQTARSNFPPEYGLTAGRYNYLPTLGWCVVLSAGVTNLASLSRPISRRAVFAAGLLAIPWLVYQQHRTTLRVAVETLDAVGPSQRSFRNSMKLVAALSQAGQRRNQPVRLPNLLWFQRPTRYTLRQFRAVAFPNGLAGLQIISANDWSEQALNDALNVFQNMNNPMRWTMVDCLMAQREAALGLLAIDQAAAARAAPATLPDFEFDIKMPYFVGRGPDHPPLPQGDPDWVMGLFSTSVRELIRLLFPQGLKHVQLVSREELTASQRAASAEVLRALDQPFVNKVREQLASDPRGTSLPALPP